MRTILAKQFRAASTRSILFTAIIGAAMSGGTVASAQTQVPPEMRKQAMSLAQTCKADYEKLCHDVQPGGGRILRCLSDSNEKLSSACRAALPDAQALASQATSAGVMPK
jgi:Cysteine rich repeat